MASAPVQPGRNYDRPPCLRVIEITNLHSFRNAGAALLPHLLIKRRRPLDNLRNSVARTRRLRNTAFWGGRTGAYDDDAGSGLRLRSISEIAGGSRRRNATAAADRSPDRGEGARQAGSPAHIGSGGDDDADGGQGIGGDQSARQFQARL